MTDKKYTHKIVMYDVNGLVRTARFTDVTTAISRRYLSSRYLLDSSGTAFNMNNIVQINPVEVIEG